MTGGVAKYWIILRVGDKELHRVGHQLASCSLLNSYVLIVLEKVLALKSMIAHIKTNLLILGVIHN